MLICCNVSLLLCAAAGIVPVKSYDLLRLHACAITCVGCDLAETFCVGGRYHEYLRNTVIDVRNHGFILSKSNLTRLIFCHLHFQMYYVFIFIQLQFENICIDIQM